jgi:16S rRNA (guanine527-N7)-methyltransferase
VADGPETLADIVPVSRETGERLAAYVAILAKWQRAENLIAASTLPDVWRRHVADSAQLVALYPQARRWLDLGSGAGFPGLVVAILGAGDSGTAVHLVESNRKKCAFLRAAIRETGAPAIVHEGRVEAVIPSWSEPVDRISARALAPLSELLKLAAPLMERGVPAAFHKGQDFVREITEATQSWAFDLVKHESRVGEGGAILDVSHLRRAPAAIVNDR